MFRFASPHFFFLLFVIPAGVYVQKKRRDAPAMNLSSLTGTAAVKPSLVLKTAWVPPLLKYLAFGLLVVASARPQGIVSHVDVMTKGINIILAVDISESMAALDFKAKDKTINRLDAVKQVIHDFIGKRKGDRIGMVVFGSEAYTQVPLTRDYQMISFVLDRLKIGAAGKSTSIGDAIGISLKRLEDIPSRSDIIILLTDGRSNSGELSPAEAADIAALKGVKIYTIGVGSRKKKAPFLISHPVFGQQYVYRQVDIDEDTLKMTSRKTKGLYFKATDSGMLKKIYDTIDQLEKTEVKTKTFIEYKEYYPHLLITALGVIFLWVLLLNTRYLRLP